MIVIYDRKGMLHFAVYLTIVIYDPLAMALATLIEMAFVMVIYLYYRAQCYKTFLFHNLLMFVERLVYSLFTLV
jgi:hypothetical protein